MMRDSSKHVSTDPVGETTAAEAETHLRELLGVVSLDEAYAELDRGELRGTIAEAELNLLRLLADPA